jgi:hypothetical protein
LLAEVYLELRGGKQFSMNLAKNNQENNETNNNNKTSNPKNTTRFVPLKEDVELHRVMVSEIKQPVWKKYNY